MKFEITKNNLATAYRIFSSALGTEKTITSYVLFRNTGNIVECVTFNGPSHCVTPIDSENLSGTVGEAFCLEGKRLDLFLKAASDKRPIEVHFDDETKVITLRDSRGAHKFPSEDPRNFPSFSNGIAAATEVAQVRADGIGSALKYLRPFIGVKDSDKGLHVTEHRKGQWLATDRASLACVEVPNLPENVNIRVHGASLKNLESFLSIWKDQMIDVLTTDTAVYYRSLDGAVFGEEVFPEPFKNIPAASLEKARDFTWTVNKEELTQALNWLRSGSDLDSHKVRFSTSPEGLTLTARSATKDLISCVVPVVSQEGDVEHDALSAGFWINIPILSRVFDICDEVITMNASVRSVRGNVIIALWVESMSQVNGNTYTAFIAQERE